MMRSKIRQDRLSLAPGLSGHQAPSSASTREETPHLHSKSLFKGQRELRIHHNEEVYRLTITNLGKLILTK